MADESRPVLSTARLVGLTRPAASLYTSTLGAHTVLADGSIAFAPSTNARIGDCTRAIVAADNSCTWIARIKSPGGNSGISGPTIVDTDGKVWTWFPFSDGKLSLETDTAGVLVYASTGATHISAAGDWFYKFVVAAGAATSTARTVTVWQSSNPTVWPSVYFDTRSIKVAKVGIGSLGSSAHSGVPLLLGESIA